MLPLERDVACRYRTLAEFYLSDLGTHNFRAVVVIVSTSAVLTAREFTQIFGLFLLFGRFGLRWLLILVVILRIEEQRCARGTHHAERVSISLLR